MHGGCFVEPPQVRRPRGLIDPWQKVRTYQDRCCSLWEGQLQRQVWSAVDSQEQRVCLKPLVDAPVEDPERLVSEGHPGTTVQ